MQRSIIFAVALCLLLWSGSALAVDEVEILGVQFPTEKVIDGKTLKLNGVAYRKAYGIVKVFVVGLYLENPTKDPQEVINSKQVKHLYFHYLTSKATSKKLQDGFFKQIKKCNPAEMFERNKKDIDLYTSWLDKDMQPGLTSVSTYVPGKGITLEYQGEVRGTIANEEFVQMYYRYNFGEKATKKIREGLLGN